VNRLETEFGTDIEFVLLDWDNRGLNDFREQFGITGRTQYVLVDAQGKVIQRWFGPLNYDSVSGYLSDYLANS